jgi:hypothetical protein
MTMMRRTRPITTDAHRDRACDRRLQRMQFVDRGPCVQRSRRDIRGRKTLDDPLWTSCGPGGEAQVPMTCDNAGSRRNRRRSALTDGARPPQFIHIKGSSYPHGLWTTRERGGVRTSTVRHVEVPSGVRFGPKGKGATPGGCWGSCAYGRGDERGRRGPIATLGPRSAGSRRQNRPHADAPAQDLRESGP